MWKWHCRLLDGYMEAAVKETRTQESVDKDVIRHEAEEVHVGVKPRPWRSERAEDSNVHEIVAWHLMEAGRHEELQGLLLDSRFIKLRLVIGGAVDLENDFEVL